MARCAARTAGASQPCSRRCSTCASPHPASSGRQAVPRQAVASGACPPEAPHPAVFAHSSRFLPLQALDTFFMSPAGGGPDDGMVSLSSCTAAFDAWRTTNASAGNASFSELPTGRYYRAATNHGDGSEGAAAARTQAQPGFTSLLPATRDGGTRLHATLLPARLCSALLAQWATRAMAAGTTRSR